MEVVLLNDRKPPNHIDFSSHFRIALPLLLMRPVQMDAPPCI